MEPSTINHILGFSEGLATEEVRPVLHTHDARDDDRAKGDLPRQELVISDSPHASISWQYSPLENAKPNLHGEAFIDGLRFGIGEIAVTSSVWSPTPASIKCVYLATLGADNRQIGKILGVSTATVKTHLRLAYRRYDVHSRTEFIRLLFENKTYSVIKPGLPLRLHEIESDAIRLASKGLSNHQIAQEIGITEGATNQRVRRAFDRNNLNGREQLALAFHIGGTAIINNYSYD